MAAASAAGQPPSDCWDAAIVLLGISAVSADKQQWSPLVMDSRADGLT